MVFDQIEYRNKPKLAGLEPLDITYESAFKLAGGDFGKANKQAVEAVARKQNPDVMMVLDIERWWETADDELSDRAVENYLEVANWYRAAAGNKPFAFYGGVPIRNYWDAVKGGSDKWRTNSLKMKPVAKIVDAVFPSLYTFYEDEAGWERYARENVKLAREIAPGKKIYPYVWPSYHDTKNRRGLKDKPIPGGVWRRQLLVLGNIADGCVIWTESKKTKLINWNSDFPWWRDTENFMREMSVR